jgi:hypothetical protein
MGLSISPTDFEAALKFLTRYYTPVHLQDVLADSDGWDLPPRAVLVTFDDGYASVMESAAPFCGEFGVPAMLFLNAVFLDNHRLAPDSLVCYVANVLGMGTVNAAVPADRPQHSLPDLQPSNVDVQIHAGNPFHLQGHVLVKNLG